MFVFQVAATGRVSIANGLSVTSGQVYLAAGLAVNGGGMSVSAGDLTVSAGSLSISSGTVAVLDAVAQSTSFAGNLIAASTSAGSTDQEALALYEGGNKRFSVSI